MKTEQLYVLYGSQMGNSEAAAKDFCTKLQSKLTPSFFHTTLKATEPIEVETTCIQLDDFLDIHHAAFTKCIVIFVSSYGVGQAPLGAHKFRAFAETLLEKTTTSTTAKEDDDNKILNGLRYAICGLGT